MAEGKREEEVEGLPGGRVFRSRSATDRSERNKPDHLYLSPGPLSSIKAAFKRTSARSHSLGDGGRERRRPEITILSVEPLPATTWFPGASAGFPTHPANSQPIWDGGIHTSGQPPPSYDQVIKEKTQETVVKPTAPPRRSHTSTTATQTDCVEEKHNQTPAPSGGTDSAVGKPRKPPRPSQPKLPPVKAAGPAEESDTPTYTETATTPNPTGPSPRPRPIPRPRSKPKQADEAETLVALQGSGRGDLVTSGENDASPSGNYLKELLEAFSSDPPLDLLGPEEVQEDQKDQGKEDPIENMNGFHSDRNIRARIQAFENQPATDEASAPSPRPRNIYTKSPVRLPKPAIAPRPSFSSPPAEEEAAATAENYYEEVNVTPLPPPLAPKPQPPRKPSFTSKDEAKPQPPIKTALLPSRPSLVRLKPVGSQDDEAGGLFKCPAPPLKPNKDLLNLNNHNSTALSRNAAQVLATAENDYEDGPFSYGPIKPARGGGLSNLASSTQSVRRPTVIRVPSRGSKDQDEASDFPPPLPVQKAIGGPTPSLKLNKGVFSSSADPILPPRSSGGKVPPPRPPPAKTGPGRPPPPRRNSVQLPIQQPGLPPRSSPLHRQSHKIQKKGPVLPPRPNPGHRLYNTYTLEIPHAIAEFDYNGTRTGELSFQKNEVLVLLNQIDSKTFECQVGDVKGTVQKSHMKIITPLSNFHSNANKPVSAQERSSSSQAFGHSVESSTLKVQALYDFTAEGPGELGLRAGDVVTNVEQLDSEWYLGTCRGSTGFFPINYVKPLTQSGPPAPAPSHERKAQPAPVTVRGPRCVARFDFEGEQSDELSFSEGDLIRLCEYVGEEWARGEVRGREGIFPLNFVEVLEDLPPPVEQNHSRIPLPGMAASFNTPAASTPAQTGGYRTEWVEAMYDFTPEAEDELPFVQGDMILVTEHLDAEWCSGRLNGREGIFPTAFVRTCSGGFP